MITDTKAGQTNYCLNCEDQARRIEELERHNRMLLDLVSKAADTIDKCGGTRDKIMSAMCIYTEALNYTPSHSAAWEWNQHVKWMKKLKPVVWQDLDDGEFITIHPLGESGYRALVAIPELKEV